MAKKTPLNILIASDKFKGSLTAKEVCNCIAVSIKENYPGANIKKMPMADGGEGSLEVLEDDVKFERRYLMVNGPAFSKIEAFYGIKDDVAYIEMAKASGLPLLPKSIQQPRFTTTLGTGEIILNAIEKGAKKIYLFVGGSATNDGGIGMAHALGYRFFDKNKIELKPIGESLVNISSIVDSPIKSILSPEVILVSDVQNPLLGPNGATRVYGAQKGASTLEIEHLEKGMKNYAGVASSYFKKDVAAMPGSGAAGGLAAGALLFLNAKIQSGIDTILDITDFDRKLKWADIVITGEGKLDQQTLHGKVIAGIMDRCSLHQKTLGVLCGINELDNRTLSKLPIKSVVAIKNDSVSIEEAMGNTEQILSDRTKTLMRVLMA